MNRHTRKNVLNIATGVAVAAMAVVVFLPAAQAAPGTLTSNVNVRSGPGTNYGVVDTAPRGQQVDVQQCQGTWCYVMRPGPDGWVSASYLSANGRPVNPGQPGLSFGFSIGPGGPSVNIGVGTPRPPAPQPPTLVRPSQDVCFYDGSRYRGTSFCVAAGESIPDLGTWGDRISSVQNEGGYSVQVCSEAGYRNCRTYTTSAATLGDFDDYIMSLRVR